MLAQYQRAPAVTRERMYLDTMESVYKHSRKVLMQTKGGNNVIYLPLDKLAPPVAVPPAPSAPASGVPSPSASPAPDSQGGVLPPQDPARARGAL